MLPKNQVSGAPTLRKIKNRAGKNKNKIVNQKDFCLSRKSLKNSNSIKLKKIDPVRVENNMAFGPVVKLVKILIKAGYPGKWAG